MASPESNVLSEIYRGCYSRRNHFGHIAKAVGVRVLISEYRRAPEHPHPAPVKEAATQAGAESRELLIA